MKIKSELILNKNEDEKLPYWMKIEKNSQKTKIFPNLSDEFWKDQLIECFFIYLCLHLIIAVFIMLF